MVYTCYMEDISYGRWHRSVLQDFQNRSLVSPYPLDRKDQRKGLVGRGMEKCVHLSVCVCTLFLSVCLCEYD